MTLNQLDQHINKTLSKKFSNNELVSLRRWIFEHFLNISIVELRINSDRIIESTKFDELNIILKKLNQNIPIQYAIGKAFFRDKFYEVNDAVLIPRVETELLVEKTIEFIKQNKIKSVLDVGTGSGCIAIEIKLACPNVDVGALDVSEKALEVAKKNAKNQNAHINFLLFDFLKNPLQQLKKYACVISNPPYILAKEIATMQANVLENEPHLALFVPDNDALTFYKRLCLYQQKINPNCALFMECSELYVKDVAQLFDTKIYDVNIFDDIFNKARFVSVVELNNQ